MAILHAFSAKEKDAETGLSYFGARYYSSDLSVWLAVDPMSGKYPHLSPFTYCANNPVKCVDPNGEDWFENEFTGDVYYNRDYRKGDERKIDGKGWKWMGENNMFDKSDDDAINTNLDKVSGVSCRQDGVDGIVSASFSGKNAETFMSNMGYLKKPLLQDVKVVETTQYSPDAMGPNSFMETSRDEIAEKTHSWVYVKTNAAKRYNVIDHYNESEYRQSASTNRSIYVTYQRRQYSYSISQKKQSAIIILTIAFTKLSKILK